MTLVSISINGREVAAHPQSPVLVAAREAGIVVPSLCWHPDLSPVGSCRLCVVEIDGLPGQPAACTLPVSPGMVIRTETPELVESRRMILEMLVAHHAHESVPIGKPNELLLWADYYGIRPSSEPAPRRYPVDNDPNPFIRVDLNQCILCTRCVRACEEVQGRFVWSVGFRGDATRIVAGLDTSMQDARCESCGACAAYCPTGALVNRASYRAPEPDRLVTTTCGYCGVGCQFKLRVRQDRVVGVSSDPAAPVNGESLCVKGRYGWDFIHHPDRLLRPRVRRELLDQAASGSVQGTGRANGRGEWVEVDWDVALRLVAAKLAAIKQESGGDAIGLLSSAKCTNEENYLMQKLARQVLGTNNIDHCARLCHSSTVAGLAMAFGSGAMSNPMRDVVDNARAIFVTGSNTTEQHPVFGAMLRQAVLRRGVKLVVADPRQIDLTEFATLHLAQRPGTDIALLNGIMHLVLKNGWQAADWITNRCEGFAEFSVALERYPPEETARLTGVSVEQLQQAAQLLAQNSPLAVIWAMGITQHITGVMNVLSLANLQMLLGNMGIPGGGVNPLRGQNNVQGACDMGALPNLLPGYQPVTDAAASQTFAAAWELTPADSDSGRAVVANPLFSNRPGLTVTEMIDLAGQRKLRALCILGEDPVMTEPDLNHVRSSLENTELVVVQEIFPSETAAYADVLLPGTSFAERNGTFTNTERRVQRIRKAIEPPGEARADWQIISELARRILANQNRRPLGPHAGWDYSSPDEIMGEVAALTPIYHGVQYPRLEHTTLHWPVWDETHPGTRILHVDRFTRGKGKFHAVDHLPPQELPDARYPLLLTTGRVLYHWHGGELTRRSAGLLEACPETLIEISPEDAQRYGISPASRVRVTSRRGEMLARVVITDRVSSGVVFGNFHFPGPNNVNNLTINALDPVAKIPEYKVCAVAIELRDP